MDLSVAGVHGSEHPLLHMEEGVIGQIYSMLNPRPPVAAGAVQDARVPYRPPHPVLKNLQLRLNSVLARRTPKNQEPGSFARVSSLMCDSDVCSGSALFFALKHDRSDATVCDLIGMNPLALTIMNTRNDTPLLVAIYEKRSFQVIQHMVLTNKDVIKYNEKNGSYPLMEAIHENIDPRIIAMLIDENGEVLRQRDHSGMLPVCRAIQKGCHIDVLKLLIYPDCVDIYDRPPVSQNIRVPLHMAVLNTKSSVEVIVFLVQQNRAALFMTDSDGMTALHLAVGRKLAQNLDVQVIQFLAHQAPAVRTMLSSNGKSPFGLAVSYYYQNFRCRKKGDEMATILLALRDEDETVLIHTSEGGNIPLMKACLYSLMLHPAVIRVLIGTKHATTTMFNVRNYKTALHYCVKSMGRNKLDNMECIHMLCANDVIFTMRDTKGCTPLHSYLCSCADIDVVKALTPIAHQSVLEMANSDGNLPLHLAIHREVDDEVLSRLMGRKEVTCSHRNENRERAIDIAMKYDGFDMARMSFFTYPGFDMITPGHRNFTLLHLALSHAHPTVIAYLLQAVPSILGVKNDRGYIPLMIAITAKIKVNDTWKLRWSNKMIRNLAVQTHAVSSEFIPSCRPIFRKGESRLFSYDVGHSVLHLALRTRRPLSVIRCIVDLDVGALIRPHPSCAYSSVTSEYYDKEFQDYREYARQTTLLPFHRALWYGADVKILKYLAEKHPTNYLFEMKDDFKNTALHMAIRQQRRSEEIKDKNLKPHSKESSLNVDAVRYLIHAGEMALLEPDEHGNTPLHLAIIVGSNAEIMQLLIEACTPPVATFRNCVEMCEMPCETAFLMQNRDLRTPLHLAMKKRDSTATSYYIMRSCSLAMLVSDKDGCTPMHLMMPMSFSILDLDHVLQILQMQPGVLLKQDHSGCTPLHTLLKNMAFNRCEEIPEDRQQIIVRLFTGATPGLLARDDTKRLMRLVDAENLSPLQYYMKYFDNWNGGYYSSVVGRELQLASRC